MAKLNRADHLNWCKSRALEILEKKGDSSEAFNSMCSDLQKHDDTCNHVGISLGFAQMLGGSLKSTSDVRNFIEGFN
ncbi:hypothetical protein [Pseudoalteromonas marina]|uniref:Uncharacterized protein n=1 Tax=Pseudoalteromonas marina TaxID=267375 RepID=A0ABT9FI58_9GAMM|nr:hypothetical protein [Pseudoalteromonas marina]MDP2566439.1 hypothetical protein [Pseudoalteromonas marina]